MALPDPELGVLIGGLCQPCRDEPGRAVARHLGAEHLLVLIRDAELDVLLPAPGFPQTLPGGPAWRALLRTCRTPGRHTGRVPYPDRSTECVAVAHVGGDGTVFLLLGGDPREPLEPLPPPLLGGMLQAELRATLAAGVAQVARDQARHAEALTLSLEAARAELERAMARAARLNEEHQRNSQFREQLLGIVSHDLRGPLSAIVTGAHTLLRRGQLDPTDLRITTRVVSSADRMTRMIDDLSDYTRSRLGNGLEIHRQPNDLHDLCRHAVDEADMAHPERTTFHLPLGDGRADCDSGRIHQLLGNLIGNAHNHGDPQAPVEVRSEGRPDRVIVEVHNRGTAIPPDQLLRIFDPFSQGESRGRRHGLGLGLFISRSIVEAHHGTIAVTSSAEDGTRFRVALPRSPASPAAFG